MADQLTPLPPEIAALLDQYATDCAYGKPGADQISRSALETAITALVRDGGQQQQNEGWTKKDQQQEPTLKEESSTC